MTVFAETNGTSPKKLYVKPALTALKLLPGETALTGCKYNNIAGPDYGTLGKCGQTWNSPCSSFRSS
jgi:hypothetical protein